jgi:hypothetical protein
MTDIPKSVSEWAREMGRKGGASKSAAKRAASAANLARARAAKPKPATVTIVLDRKAKLTEQELRAIVAKYLPEAGEPEPMAKIFDDLAQEGGE